MTKFFLFYFSKFSTIVTTRNLNFSVAVTSLKFIIKKFAGFSKTSPFYKEFNSNLDNKCRHYGSFTAVKVAAAKRQDFSNHEIEILHYCPRMSSAASLQKTRKLNLKKKIRLIKINAIYPKFSLF